MNIKEFNQFLSTEKFLIKTFNEYDKLGNYYSTENDDLGHPKYKDRPLQYHVDKALIKFVSKPQRRFNTQEISRY